MINFKHIFIITLILGVFSSCSDATEDNFEIQERNNEDRFMVIDEVDELPDVSVFRPFVESIEFDNERETILDKEESKLLIPISADSLNGNEYDYFETFGIIIARYKPKTGCLSCVDCIGFRCSFIRNPATPVIIGAPEFESILQSKFSNNQLSTDREQDFVVRLDYANQILEFHSSSLLDWESYE